MSCHSHVIAEETQARDGCRPRNPDGCAWIDDAGPLQGHGTRNKNLRRDTPGLGGMRGTSLGLPDGRPPARRVASRPGSAPLPNPWRAARPRSTWRDHDAAAARRAPHHGPGHEKDTGGDGGTACAGSVGSAEGAEHSRKAVAGEGAGGAFMVRAIERTRYARGLHSRIRRCPRRDRPRTCLPGCCPSS